MFCPNCGIQDTNRSQYCRACGAELNNVRTALERPDPLTGAGISAREEIGRAIADRIRDLNTARDLKQVVEDVLPQIAEFLESPEERRLRQLREGTITAAVGVGLIVAFLLVSSISHTDKAETLGLLGAAAGIIVFMVGLGIIVNGVWLTALSGRIKSRSKSALSSNSKTASFPDEPPASQPLAQPFVTESTTRQLR